MEYRTVPPDFFERHRTELDVSIYERQRMLLRTFAASQAYGKHVRTLHWTIMEVKDWSPLDPELEDASYLSEANSDTEYIPIYEEFEDGGFSNCSFETY